MIVIMLSLILLIFYFPDLPIYSSSSGFNRASDDYVERFFPDDKVIDIHVIIDPADFADMLENPLAEKYKVANVIVDGQRVDYVGIQTKGNSSLRSVASSDSDRYSFKIDFNQYIKLQTLEGLTKLNLNNSFSDPSYMREYLSYQILKEMGVPTPESVYTNVYINGELWGLYLAIEGIEEPFLDRYYGRDWGTLYKSDGGVGSDLIYTDDNIDSYSGLRRMTKQKIGSDERLVQMIKALNTGVGIEKHLNIDQVLRYFAVNTVLVNMDSYVGQFMHNYYLYESNGYFTVLPWDYNMSFGGFGRGGGSQSGTELLIDQPVEGTTLEARPLLGKLLEVPQYKELYHKYIADIINGSFNLENMSQEIQRIATMIRPHLEKDPTKFFSMEQIEAAIGGGTSIEGAASIAMRQANPNATGLRGGNMLMGGSSIDLISFVRDRIDNISKQLSGELPTTGGSNQYEQRFPDQLNQAVDNPRNMRREWQEPIADRFMSPENFALPEGMELTQFERRGNDLPQQIPGQWPGMDNQRGNQGMESGAILNTPNTEIYLTGVASLVMLLAVLILFRKRTKYSV